MPKSHDTYLRLNFFTLVITFDLIIIILLSTLSLSFFSFTRTENFDLFLAFRWVTAVAGMANLGTS